MLIPYYIYMWIQQNFIYSDVDIVVALGILQSP